MLNANVWYELTHTQLCHWSDAEFYSVIFVNCVNEYIQLKDIQLKNKIFTFDFHYVLEISTKIDYFWTKSRHQLN